MKRIKTIVAEDEEYKLTINVTLQNKRPVYLGAFRTQFDSNLNDIIRTVGNWFSFTKIKLK